MRALRHQQVAPAARRGWPPTRVRRAPQVVGERLLDHPRATRAVQPRAKGPAERAADAATVRRGGLAGWRSLTRRLRAATISLATLQVPLKRLHVLLLLVLPVQHLPTSTRGHPATTVNPKACLQPFLLHSTRGPRPEASRHSPSTSQTCPRSFNPRRPRTRS